MKRLIAATVVLASLPGFAFAQGKKDDSPMSIEEQQKKKDAAEIDKRYKSTLDKTRQETTAVKTDPWSNMRGADDAKAKR